MGPDGEERSFDAKAGRLAGTVFSAALLIVVVLLALGAVGVAARWVAHAWQWAL